MLIYNKNKYFFAFARASSIAFIRRQDFREKNKKCCKRIMDMLNFVKGNLNSSQMLFFMLYLRGIRVMQKIKNLTREGNTMKNQKVVTLVGIIIVLCAIFTSCKTDPVNTDLMSYVNEKLPAIAELETTIGKDYESVTGEKFVDDDTLSKKLKDVIIPNSSKLIENSQAVIPETEEVKQVHAKYISSIKTQHEGLVLLLSGAQKHDSSKVDAANEKLSQASKISEEYNSDLNALAKDHNVEIGKK